MSIGSNIRFFRKQNKMTQTELAKKSGISRSYLADIEHDRYNPSLDVLKSVAEALQVGTHMLLADNPLAEITAGKNHPPQLLPKEEKDIARDLEKMLNDLESSEALAFQGEPLDEASKELLRISLENSLRLAKQLAKQKFTPHKFRK
ncbi:helix-turn-helix domain-containing protein [Brevibacillus massiliensis]|uniref:helix-turn-helix domain-containing protein n=1 Tax=Brevibacillus massiliensis TaxID=1118054 RepID=UPI000300B913|nr:helix-turn-helix domain-containing protein [Brevibacillus massiliensis]